MSVKLEIKKGKLNLIKTAFIVMSVSFPIITYYWIFTSATPDIPFWDDYYSTLEFLTAYLNSDSLPNKLNLVFKQHNEHKIVLSRLLSVLNHSLTGKVNFQLLNFFGNLSLLGILYLFFKILSRHSRQYLYFVPVPFLLFQLQYWNGSNWTIVTTTMFWGTLFAFSSLYLLSNIAKSYRAFAGAVLFAVLATFTNGNGMFTFIAGLFVLFLSGYPRKFILVWSAAMIAAMLIYFLNYTKQPNQPELLAMLFTNPFGVIRYFLSFIGSAVLTPLTVAVSAYIYDPYILKPLKGACLTLSILTGLLFCFLYLYLFLFKLQYLKNNPLLFSMLTFLLLTGCAAALSRANLGLVQAFTARYKFNSLLIIIIYYFIFLEISRAYSSNHKKYYIFFITLSVLFYWLTFGISRRELDSHRDELIAGIKLYYQTKDTSRLGFYADPKVAIEILEKADKNKVYRLPEKFLQ